MNRAFLLFIVINTGCAHWATTRTGPDGKPETEINQAGLGPAPYQQEADAEATKACGRRLEAVRADSSLTPESFRCKDGAIEFNRGGIWSPYVPGMQMNSLWYGPTSSLDVQQYQTIMPLSSVIPSQPQVASVYSSNYTPGASYPTHGPEGRRGDGAGGNGRRSEECVSVPLSVEDSNRLNILSEAVARCDPLVDPSALDNPVCPDYLKDFEVFKEMQRKKTELRCEVLGGQSSVSLKIMNTAGGGPNPIAAPAPHP